MTVGGDARAQSLPWKQVLLDDVAARGSGHTPDKKRADYWNGGIPWVSLKDTFRMDRGLVSTTTETITRMGLANSSAVVHPMSSVVLLRDAGIGKSAVLGADMAVSQHFMAWNCGPCLDNWYLYYYFQYMKPEFDRISNGSTIKTIGLGYFRQLEIPLPPIEEQRLIAQALRDADDRINILERMLAKKQAIKQGMMQKLLTGKSRLPGFIEPWSAGIFEQLAVPSRERAMPRDVPPTTPLVELEQIESGSGRLVGKSQAADAISLKAVFRPGDVLFGKLRAYLRKFWYADVAGLCTTEIWVLRARPGVDSRFVRFIVDTDRFIEAASGAYGTHMPRSDWGTVRSLSVAIPPHDEQRAIASALADIDREISILHARLANARDVKQGMMQQLLTGRTRLSAREVA